MQRQQLHIVSHYHSHTLFLLLNISILYTINIENPCRNYEENVKIEKVLIIVVSRETIAYIYKKRAGTLLY